MNTLTINIKYLQCIKYFFHGYFSEYVYLFAKNFVSVVVSKCCDVSCT